MSSDRPPVACKPVSHGSGVSPFGYKQPQQTETAIPRRSCSLNKENASLSRQESTSSDTFLPAASFAPSAASSNVSSPAKPWRRDTGATHPILAVPYRAHRAFPDRCAVSGASQCNTAWRCADVSDRVQAALLQQRVAQLQQANEALTNERDALKHEVAQQGSHIGVARESVKALQTVLLSSAQSTQAQMRELRVRSMNASLFGPRS